MSLLFVDLLGVRAQWSAGGRAAVQARCTQFEALISGVLGRPSLTAPLLGAVESDAAAFDFATDEAAIHFGAALYRAAFERPRRPSDPRLWLRGTIVPAPQGASLRTTASLSTTIAFVQRTAYSDPLLDAIAIEKSGFRGMRLLIADALLTHPVRSAFGRAIGSRTFTPFRRLQHSAYPSRIASGYSDILWMTIGDTPAWGHATTHMASMLRWAAGEAEEFQQAASTQLVFNEVAAIYASLRA